MVSLASGKLCSFLATWLLLIALRSVSGWSPAEILLQHTWYLVRAAVILDAPTDIFVRRALHLSAKRGLDDYFHMISFLYTEVDATVKIPLRDTAKEDVERLLRFVEGAIQEAKGGVRITRETIQGSLRLRS